MKRHVAAMALVLAVGSLSACAEYTTTGVPEDSASAVAEQGADQQDALSGTSWALTDSSLEGGGLDQFEITAEFADGTMSGKGPVNRYSASYEVSGDQITLGPVSGTKMAGDAEAMEAEGAYFALLSTVTAFHQDGDQLVLMAEEAPVLTFQAAGANVAPDEQATQAVADSVVGKSAADAEKAVTAAGLTYRVISEDGKSLPATMDYRPDRVNVALVDDKVESVTVG